jgi:hypothetical protein
VEPVVRPLVGVRLIRRVVHPRQGQVQGTLVVRSGNKVTEVSGSPFLHGNKCGPSGPASHSDYGDPIPQAVRTADTGAALEVPILGYSGLGGVTPCSEQNSSTLWVASVASKASRSRSAPSGLCPQSCSRTTCPVLRSTTKTRDFGPGATAPSVKKDNTPRTIVRKTPSFCGCSVLTITFRR